MWWWIIATAIIEILQNGYYILHKQQHCCRCELFSVGREIYRNLKWKLQNWKVTTQREKCSILKWLNGISHSKWAAKSVMMPVQKYGLNLLTRQQDRTWSDWDRVPLQTICAAIMNIWIYNMLLSLAENQSCHISNSSIKLILFNSKNFFSIFCLVSRAGLYFHFYSFI